MDYFEATIRRLLEEEGYWTKQSFKVELTKGEKRQIGKPSIPRPEIDLIAYKPSQNELLAIEVKSLLDSGGVKLFDLQQDYEVPKGKYKLFTCSNYRKIVFNRLSNQLFREGQILSDVHIRLGLAAGNVHKNLESEMRSFSKFNDFFFWGPSDIREKVKELAMKGYENDPTVMAAKILVRN